MDVDKDTNPIKINLLVGSQINPLITLVVNSGSRNLLLPFLMMLELLETQHLDNRISS